MVISFPYDPETLAICNLVVGLVVPTGYTFTFVGYIVEQGDSKRTVSKLINDDGAEAQIVSIP